MTAPLHRVPLVSLNSEPSHRRSAIAYDTDSDDGEGKRRQPWYHYLPLCGTVLLILLPHPSLLLVLVRYHLLTLSSLRLFLLHAAVLYTLTFLAFCSLIVCAVRDPGPVPSAAKEEEEDAEDGGGMSLSAALMGGPPDDEYMKPGMWCRVCWAPKPERAHHCSTCGRCVLKMDHHCPWVGATCVGYRTYPSFLHFLLCVSLYAAYVAGVAIEGLTFAFKHPMSLDGTTPLHMLFLAFLGVVFGLIIGSFFGYHVYLTLTNQTTLENISHSLVLRHLPPLPGGLKLSSPPLEHELSSAQRRAVRAANRALRLYDLGPRANVAQALGGWPKSGRAWAKRVLWGGSNPSGGTRWPRNPRAEEGLARLARVLVKLEVDGDAAFDSEDEGSRFT